MDTFAIHIRFPQGEYTRMVPDDRGLAKTHHSLVIFLTSDEGFQIRDNWLMLVRLRLSSISLM